jgi:hypothetical protein
MARSVACSVLMPAKRSIHCPLEITISSGISSQIIHAAEAEMQEKRINTSAGKVQYPKNCCRGMILPVRVADGLSSCGGGGALQDFKQQLIFLSPSRPSTLMCHMQISSSWHQLWLWR